MSPTWIRLLLIAAMCFMVTRVVGNAGELRIPSAFYRNEYDVYVINGCNNKTIAGNCTSSINREAHFVRFRLQNRGDEKKWTFEVSKGNHATYSCMLFKGSGYSQYVVVFDQIRDAGRCGRSHVCRYKASDDGIYFGGGKSLWGGRSRWALVANWTSLNAPSN